jgi:hypothetical protein
MYTPDKRSVHGTLLGQRTLPKFSVLDTPDLPTLRRPALNPRQQKQHYFSTIREWGMIGLLLAIALLDRLYAAFHTGLEVDEPIYRYAAAYAMQYGFPAVRPAASRQIIPFLYHPPFFLWFLGLWFKAWGSDSYLTGRLFSVLCSAGMLMLLYAFVCRHLGKGVAALTLCFVGTDAWIIFTNQAIYLENSQMLFVILAMWAYWHATQVDATHSKQYVRRYLFAGLLIGWVIIYKHIGGFLVISVLANLAMQRMHWRGHVILFVVILGILTGYVLFMHEAFGSLYDLATITQIRRTLWDRQSAGLTYSPLIALQAIGSRYWIFPTTILVLVGGSLLAVIRFIQHVLGRRKEKHPIILGWALGGVVFALSISLKSPHYMILWLIPLYILLSKELYYVLNRQMGKRKSMLNILLVGLFIVNLWSFQARFVNLPGDALAQADAYINTFLPSNALVATQDYIGVDIAPQYVNIALYDTPALLFKSRATYAALYWSTTEPLPTSLGNINSYCIPLKTFSGFKDHIEVCKIDRVALTTILRHSPSLLKLPEEMERKHTRAEANEKR